MHVGKESKKGGAAEPDLPPVGSTVRYIETVPANAQGLYEVKRIIRGVERPLEISNGTRRLQVRVSSVVLESGPASNGKPAKRTGKSPVAQIGKLVWYRGPLRKHNGIAMIDAIEGDRLTYRGGLDGSGKRFFGGLDTFSRITVAEVHDEDQILCGYCQSELDSLEKGEKCSSCHQRVMAVTTAYDMVTIPDSCKLPEIPRDVAALTTSK